MFDLKRPCVTCPFRRGQGSLFRLPPDRLTEIFRASAFQCHKTIDYEAMEDGGSHQGDHPQQCAGLMAVLHQEERHNQIMQVAERLGAFDPSKLVLSDAYSSFEEVRRAHAGYEPDTGTGHVADAVKEAGEEPSQ